MQHEITVIKTLPHLIPQHLEQRGIGFYASTYSPQIAKFFSLCRYYLIKDLDLQIITNILSFGYNRTDVVSEQGDFNQKGDVLNIWPVGYSSPIRISLFDEQIESVYTYDAEYGRKQVDLEGVYLSRYPETDQLEVQHLTVDLDATGTDFAIFTSFEPDIYDEVETKYEKFDYVYPQLFWNRLELFEQEVERLDSLGYAIQIDTKHGSQLPESLYKYIDRSFCEIELAAGFVSADQKEALFTDREIFGTVYIGHQEAGGDNTSRLLKQLDGEIKPGDYVVHSDYGVGIYAGLTQEYANDQLHEYLQVKYADEDELLVPIAQIDRISKYIGQEGKPPKITPLSKKKWEKEKKKVTHAVKVLAAELVEHYARRELADALVVPKGDSSEFEQFVSEFPHPETNDQLRAINEIIADLETGLPMNRLLIGDVGFGKTEVMIRAAYKIIEAGAQVAILCPTTVLASQHYAVLKDRFKNTDFQIASLSRFNTNKENQDAIMEINKGEIDIVVGTHRLLSNDVRFSNLGLLIVDEEQRFGVKQKEKIKQINYGVHHLAVSATPIPRTMSMALSSIQDISMITTSPKGRKPIKTELIRDKWNQLVEAIHDEVSRGGQVYFVHNEVQSLPTIKQKLQTLLPGISIQVAHGQMSPSQLDQAMINFYQGKSSVLLCTTIIENGLDLPNVNTIIVNRAHRFGLAQLYQLRGRVGRSDRQAYCYLFYEGRSLDDDFTDSEQKKVVRKYISRLQSLVDASELGSGFHVASRDLELRGAGTLLGEKQSGNISQVGYSLYMQLLAKEIERLKQLNGEITKPEYLTL